MKTKTKISLIIGVSLFILGAVIFVGAMFMLNWNFLKLSTVKYETNTYEINEQFSDISIITDTADITFISSDDGKTKIVCDEAVNEKHNVYVSENTLKIEVDNQRKWYHYIGINFKTPKLTVYLGENQLENLIIKEDTGDIKIPAQFSFSSIDIKLSTGDVENYACASADIKIETTTGQIKTENITAQNVSLTASTGKIDVTGLKASGDLKLAVSTGKTILNNITCKNITYGFKAPAEKTFYRIAHFAKHGLRQNTYANGEDKKEVNHWYKDFGDPLRKNGIEGRRTGVQSR